MTMQQEYEVTHGLARKIARALGGDWTYERPAADLGHSATLTHPGGGRLHVRVMQQYASASERGKVIIHGGFENGLHVHAPRGVGFEIGVSASRGPERIAAEIARRLLPAYLAALEEAKAAQTKEAEAKAKQAALLDELAADGHGERRNGSVHWCNGESSFYGELSVDWSAESVTLKLDNLPLDTARRIVGILKELTT